jgi:hypothetical protein
VDRDIKGLQIDGPESLSVSVVNVGLPIHISDEGADAQPTMFALSVWRLPRVPCIGEQIIVDAIPIKGTVEKVWWDSEGRAVLTLQPVRLDGRAIEALERDGWRVAPWEDEPPSDWLAD